jgi:hypothetical protein
MQRLQRLYAAGAVPAKKLTQRIASWIGHAQHADTYRLRERLLGEFVFCRVPQEPGMGRPFDDSAGPA